MACRPVIIEAALNGGTSPDVNPSVPRTPEAVTADALACIELGASIIHAHPAGGYDDFEGDIGFYTAAFAPVLEKHPDVLIYPTARMGPADMPVQTSWGANETLGRQGLIAMSLVDPGSVNIGMRPDGSVSAAFAGRPYLNSHADTEYKLRRSADLRLGPSISIFDPSFLRATLGFRARGLVPAGTMVKLYFGEDEVFGLRPTSTALEAYLELIEGAGLVWAAAVLGGDILADGFGQRVVERGGHIRVGLEDETRRTSHTNADLTARAAGMLRAAGCRPASISETRAILGMPDARRKAAGGYDD